MSANWKASNTAKCGNSCLTCGIILAAEGEGVEPSGARKPNEIKAFARFPRSKSALRVGTFVGILRDAVIARSCPLVRKTD